jgi:putative FmdB family regulatory protein
MYQYKCTACECVHEKLQKFNELAPACPKCDGTSDIQEKQLSSGTGILCLGYGWTRNGMSVGSRR